MERDLKNKLIAVTGGAEGIGFQIIRYFLKNEAKLAIILDINEETAKKAVEKLATEFGPNKVIYMKCDVVEGLEEIYEKIYVKFGIIDVLVNSAGVVDKVGTKKCIDINLTATINWSLKFMELMRKDKNGNGGTIINIASIFGYRINRYSPVYTATKFGVVGFTRALGHEKRYKKKQVRAIVICPGYTKTNLTQYIQDGNTEQFKEVKNSYQWQSPEEVGEKVIEVFKIADSGTIWEIEGGKLKEVN